jgi:GNAT superfamily N-acetyltransferase
MAAHEPDRERISVTSLAPYDATMSIDPVPLSAIEFADDEVASIKELTELYEAVGWTSHSDDPDALARAVDRSDFVITARTTDGDLVGLTRCLTDDVYACMVQDVLVHPDHQRTGIGSVMVGRCLRVYGHVQQVTVMSDGDAGVTAFYRSLGFSDADAHQLHTHVVINT